MHEASSREIMRATQDVHAGDRARVRMKSQPAGSANLPAEPGGDGAAGPVPIEHERAPHVRAISAAAADVDRHREINMVDPGV